MTDFQIGDWRNISVPLTVRTYRCEADRKKSEFERHRLLTPTILPYDISAMHEQVQKALQVLIGKPLWSSGRAADLEWFQFGQRKTVKGVRGDTKEVGEYAIHVQCAWRMRHSDQVVVASRDLYYPATETDGPVQDFDWDVQGANRRDRLIAELFQNETRQFFVPRGDRRQCRSLHNSFPRCLRSGCVPR